MIVLDKFKIKELMAKKKIDNFTELAKMLGISKNQLSNILSSRFKPIKSNVMEIAEFLDVNPLDIIKNKK
ncbi:MAG: helix-turn-helix transcriptional regulator [Bacilli bacterium]|jgi:DNA (cytosine-5)-methyltransferase 1|nr:helix-turn-helix transcriptional regulator [Bacilli bacterium]